MLTRRPLSDSAPWLDNVRVVLPMWAGVLEQARARRSRFRRAAYLRVGYGTGHRTDTLDLQVVAHACPMTIDGGQREGILRQPTHDSDHNTVGSMAEDTPITPGSLPWRSSRARYLAARRHRPQAARYFRRQIALVDVGEGLASRKLSIPSNGRAPPCPGRTLRAPTCSTSSSVRRIVHTSASWPWTTISSGNATGSRPPPKGVRRRIPRMLKRKPELSVAGIARHVPGHVALRDRWTTRCRREGDARDELLPFVHANSPGCMC